MTYQTYSVKIQIRSLLRFRPCLGRRYLVPRRVIILSLLGCLDHGLKSRKLVDRVIDSCEPPVAAALLL